MEPVIKGEGLDTKPIMRHSLLLHYSMRKVNVGWLTFEGTRLQYRDPGSLLVASTKTLRDTYSLEWNGNDVKGYNLHNYTFPHCSGLRDPGIRKTSQACPELNPKSNSNAPFSRIFWECQRNYENTFHRYLIDTLLKLFVKFRELLNL
jgi:hypothetical protein